MGRLYFGHTLHCLVEVKVEFSAHIWLACQCLVVVQGVINSVLVIGLLGVYQNKGSLHLSSFCLAACIAWLAVNALHIGLTVHFCTDLVRMHVSFTHTRIGVAETVPASLGFTD